MGKSSKVVSTIVSIYKLTQGLLFLFFLFFFGLPFQKNTERLYGINSN